MCVNFLATLCSWHNSFLKMSNSLKQNQKKKYEALGFAYFSSQHSLPLPILAKAGMSCSPAI